VKQAKPLRTTPALHEAAFVIQFNDMMATRK
jgi:hypothetical protein